MIPRRSLGAAVFTLSCILAGPIWAQPASVAVTQVWARATAGPVKTGALYATITASQPDRLTGASTPVASMAELHKTIMSNGVMQMREVKDGLAVTPGTPLQMQPGGYHIMLMGLKSPLRKGEQFPVTLTFEHAGPVTTQALVSAAGASQPDVAIVPPTK